MHYKVGSKYKEKIRSGLLPLLKNALSVCGGQIELDDVSSRYMKNNSAGLKHPKSISNGAQCVSLDSKIYCEKVKMCRFSSRH
jgi:hypothetical protein